MPMFALNKLLNELITQQTKYRLAKYSRHAIGLQCTETLFSLIYQQLLVIRSERYFFIFFIIFKCKQIKNRWIYLIAPSLRSSANRPRTHCHQIAVLSVNGERPTKSDNSTKYVRFYNSISVLKVHVLIQVVFGICEKWYVRLPSRFSAGTTMPIIYWNSESRGW